MSRPRDLVRLLAAGILLLPVGCALAPAVVEPLRRAHAHNDYEHPRPLLDALAQGFCSVEADVHLVGGELLVAHDRADVEPGRTLASLYLSPLRQRVRRNGGSVYPAGGEFFLLVDVKSAAAPTYRALVTELASYAEMLTHFGPGMTDPRAVTVVLSGNRSRRLLAQDSERLVALDGRLADLDSGASPHLIPWISDRWSRAFRWQGAGAMPDGERRALRRLVDRAHAQGRLIRFWAIPDQAAGWRELWDAGVDLIQSDDLAALGDFLRRRECAVSPGREPATRAGR